MVRYCSKSPGCAAGWGSIGCLRNGRIEYRSCLDEPPEKNCLNLVEGENASGIEFCASCGTPLGITEG